MVGLHLKQISYESMKMYNFDQQLKISKSVCSARKLHDEDVYKRNMNFLSL